MPVVDQANGTGLACTAFNAVNTLAVNGKIALIDRGTCTFPEKVKNAQNAGAIGVIIADNAAGSPPPVWAARSDHHDSGRAHHAGRWQHVQERPAIPLSHALGRVRDHALNTAIYAGADPPAGR